LRRADELQAGATVVSREMGRVYRECAEALRASSVDTEAGGSTDTRLSDALRHFADESSWEVSISDLDINGTKFRFHPPTDSVYSTPWGVARAALAAAGQTAAEDERDGDT
jgi:hypothetical protein